ncbi:cell division protein FtsQ/DivIB [Methylocystis sp. B8]|uniref:cell division protein FtsQ/DivIB n=1 Tax=Methylocystis sp. B8 TaxID=544938 RepID=UPI0010FD615A|nr:cell division protein FtsQ/DivIB [Methylocystis sp. B8]TLG78919.1 FtsQ-type POTRA domain-containing protein [Methylocystis sp. B8]
MDGGRRILRSLKESFAARHSLVPIVPGESSYALAAVVAVTSVPSASAPAAVAPRAPSRKRRGGRLLSRLALLGRPGVGSLATIALFVFVGAAGFIENGGYTDLVAREGELYDIAARVAGFPISAVTITGQSRLSERELLDAAGVGLRNSLPFLDATAVRDRLMQVPLVKSARVMKLYPSRLVIAIEERQPSALWQRDGRVAVISEDGVPIDELRDQRYLGLPFVVGEGAQKRLPEFLMLMTKAGDLSHRIKAGVLVAGRRWNFEMTNGVTVKLPEIGPAEALETLARLQREARILDKDVMFVDLRIPDRVSVRLTEEAAATREAQTAPRKSSKSGG